MKKFKELVTVMVEMCFGFQLDFKLFDYDPEYIFGVLKIESNID